MGFYDFINWMGDIGEWAAGRKDVVKKDGVLRFGILGAANIAYVLRFHSCEEATRWIRGLCFNRADAF